MRPYYDHAGIQLYLGDSREVLPQLVEPVNCCVTSPPYWGLRDYGNERQMGLESTPAEYVEGMTAVFRSVSAALRDDGTLWLNLGDSYCSPNGRSNGGLYTSSTLDIGEGTNVARNAPMHRNWPNMKPKDLVGIPWMLAFALRDDGWYLRSEIIWAKPNPMPESVTDRPTKSHEQIFLMSKSQTYYYDQEAILEPVSANTHLRISQNLAAQIGSQRANGGTRADRPMKAVARSRESWNGSRFDGPRDLEIRPNTGRKRAESGSGIKYNDSFDASVILPVEARNKRSVWTVNVQGFSEAHFATFPEDLIKPCILAGCPQGGIVLDPFAGAGTTLLVAKQNHCRAIGIEICEEYCEIAVKRLNQDVFEFR